MVFEMWRRKQEAADFGRCARIMMSAMIATIMSERMTALTDIIIVRARTLVRRYPPALRGPSTPGPCRSWPSMSGIAAVGIRNPSHCGRALYFMLMAAREGRARAKRAMPLRTGRRPFASRNIVPLEKAGRSISAARAGALLIPI
ncbi:hypothetical protein XH90_09555 [Bradyrhizobium sp. CCBAU 53338]|nr:hypothetical protein XH90_09555 [Bradyrhizobium sp. CCBAU 53338]